MKILKVVWCVFESFCFGAGLFILIVGLTTTVTGGRISIQKGDKQESNLSQDKTKCVITLSEENKHE